MVLGKGTDTGVDDLEVLGSMYPGFLQTLGSGAQHNINYTPSGLHESIRGEIHDALWGQNVEAARDRKIMELATAIASRVAQTVQAGGTRAIAKRPFEQEPPSRIKSCKLVLTHPADRNVAPLIIDPLRLSDVFLEHMGYGDRIAGKKGHEKIRAKADLISELLPILDQLEPISLNGGQGSHRMFRISTGPRKGNILKVGENHGELVFSFTGIEKGRESFGKITEGYEGETPRLADVLQEMDYVCVLLANWVETKTMPIQMEKLVKNLLDVIEKLDKAYEKNKVILRDAAIKALTFITEQPASPGAARACMHTARVDRVMGKRYVAIPHIESHLREDNHTLNIIAEREQRAVESIYYGFNPKHGAKKSIAKKLDIRAINPKQRFHADSKTAFCTDVHFISSECARVLFYPNMILAERMRPILDKIAHTLTKHQPSELGEREVACTLTKRAYMLSKLAIATHFFNLLYRDFSLQGMQGFEVKKFAERESSLDGISKFLGKDNVVTEEDLTQFQPALVAVASAVPAMKACIEVYKKSSSRAERARSINELKARIDELDIAQYVKQAFPDGMIDAWTST